ncbi:Na+/H+ antiporter NhaC [Ammoniphilus resinae]|uniref:NhaC family Na+:H+ antiporter n=1 Tax=Ammoniphilus resinae TaxID=861532 RepID=A0ABS4GM84_9BACL|nr:Na+/H+ antiporter NhaC [Ammoniphilus resinae]MBP1931376.1 NhaC family Na+:H+ antiporter [Ammoniphilus resinae]
MNKEGVQVKPIEAWFIVALILLGMSTMITKMELVPHIPIITCILFLLLYGLAKRHSIQNLEIAMVEGARAGLQAVYIFFFIGMLISSWMASGTIPTFLFLGLQLVSEHFFLAVVFAVTAVVGMGIGSSLTTAATVGVAFLGIGTAAGINPAWMAGAIVSGAFFGDKMSPLSDTTNLASGIVHVDLFEHIKNMLWTTIPAFVLSFGLYMVLSPTISKSQIAKLSMFQRDIVGTGLVSWVSLLPILILVLLVLKKMSAIITLSSSISLALLISFIVQDNWTMTKAFQLLFSGYKSGTGISDLDTLLTRGGMESMMFSISLVILALSMGGLLQYLGIINAIMQGAKHLTRTVSLISATAATAIGINLLLGEQYLSILLTGKAFQDNYRKSGLKPKNLSRVLEDAGTVVNPLVPWSVCGVFLTSTLSVPTIAYMPFAFFCLLSPLITLLFGLTGISISREGDFR